MIPSWGGFLHNRGGRSAHPLFFSLYRGVGGGARVFFWGASPPQPPRAGAPPRTPGDFLVRRKSPKTHQEPPCSWTSGEGGVAPFDPPALCPSGIGCAGLNLQASSGAPHLPSHGLKTQSVPSMKPKEKTRPICPQTQSGKSVYFCGTSPIAGVAATPQGERERKVKHFSLGPPRGSTQRGTPSGRFFGDFLIGEKVTRVQGGAPAYQGR